jgi:trehalose-6-phosphate synthase
MSPGGLVAAVEPALRGKNAAWVGWDGTDSGPEDAFDLQDVRVFPVSLSADLVRRHYEGFSNSTLWPLFHDVGVKPEFHPDWWEAYREVNLACATTAATIAEPGGIVWIHDYQMMVVPGILRELRPDLTIGYFHHIPLCSPEKSQVLPEFHQLFSGLSGADIAGFQRDVDSGNFRSSMVLLNDSVKRVRAETYPISVDFEAVSSSAADPGVLERAQELRVEWGNPITVFLGVDRIDYTKGIPERLEAFESLLRSEEISVEECVMVQAGSPSREGVVAYQELAVRIGNIVERINADFRTTSGRPAVVYGAENLERAEMLALFVAADVMVVSSLRDGMNLVAKEFVACKRDEAGVLVLSPHTGAADRMVEALIADPTIPGELAQALLDAQSMELSEQHQRMVALRSEVRTHDVSGWAAQILEDLASLRTQG